MLEVKGDAVYLTLKYSLKGVWEMLPSKSTTAVSRFWQIFIEEMHRILAGKLGKQKILSWISNNYFIVNLVMRHRKGCVWKRVKW